MRIIIIIKSQNIKKQNMTFFKILRIIYPTSWYQHTKYKTLHQRVSITCIKEISDYIFIYSFIHLSIQPFLSLGQCKSSYLGFLTKQCIHCIYVTMSFIENSLITIC